MRYETFVVHHISQDFADFLFKVKLIELKCNTREVTILFSLILRAERNSTQKSAFLIIHYRQDTCRRELGKVSVFKQNRIHVDWCNCM